MVDNIILPYTTVLQQTDSILILRNTTVLTLQYWQYSIDSTVLTLQYWHYIIDTTVLTLQYWHYSIDTTVLTLQYWQCFNIALHYRQLLYTTETPSTNRLTEELLVLTLQYWHYSIDTTVLTLQYWQYFNIALHYRQLLYTTETPSTNRLTEELLTDGQTPDTRHQTDDSIIISAIESLHWRPWNKHAQAQGHPPLRWHGFIKSTLLEGRAAPTPWWCYLSCCLCFLSTFWLVTRQSYSLYVHFRGVTKWAIQACTMPLRSRRSSGTVERHIPCGGWLLGIHYKHDQGLDPNLFPV